jgi:hypothetical protein
MFSKDGAIGKAFTGQGESELAHQYEKSRDFPSFETTPRKCIDTIVQVRLEAWETKSEVPLPKMA